MPIRLTYVLVVLGLGLIIMGGFWYILFEVIMPIRWAAIQTISTLPKNDQTDPIFTLADSFIVHLWSFFLVFGVIALAAWAFTYSQEKGRILE
jgi:hypothetical protein